MTRKEARKEQVRELYEEYAKIHNHELLAVEHNPDSANFGIMKRLTEDFNFSYHLYYIDYFQNVQSIRAFNTKHEALTAFFALVQNPDEITMYPF